MEHYVVILNDPYICWHWKDFSYYMIKWKQSYKREGKHLFSSGLCDY